MRNICQYLAGKNQEKSNQTITGFEVALIVVLAIFLLIEFTNFINTYTFSVFFGLFKLLMTFGLIVAVPIMSAYLKSTVKSERKRMALNDKINQTQKQLDISKGAINEYHSMKNKFFSNLKKRQQKRVQKRGNE